MTSDVERLRREISLQETASRLGVKLVRDGHEFVSCCPFHSEDTPSFTIFTGNDHIERFHCFGCGEKGDVLDFVMAIQGCKLPEAIKILGGATPGNNIQPKKIVARDIYAGITPIEPPEGGIVRGKKIKLYNPKRQGEKMEWGAFSPSGVYPYRDEDGSLFGYVLRHDLPDGGKETPMVMFCRLDDGTETWCRFPFPKARKLYGVEAVANVRQVFVVEGEKCRDAFSKMTARTAVSWPGGTQGVKHCDWSPLAGKNIVIWPDFDAPGFSTAKEIATILVGLGCTVRILDIEASDRWKNSGNPKKGWDCADADAEGWSKDDVDNFMRSIPKRFTVDPDPNTPDPDRDLGPAPAPASTVREARTVQQEKPEEATVTDIKTRQSYTASDVWMHDLVTNEEGKVKPSVTKNWALFLENHPSIAGTFAWDAFKMRTMLMKAPPWEKENSSWEIRAVQDRDYSEAVMWLEGLYMTPKPTGIVSVIQTVAEHHSFDRLNEYLEGLVWDGTPRVKGWLSYYLGVEDTEYSRAIGLRWLVSSVARGLSPGCKVDTMPILEGPQGARKSEIFRRLYGPEFYTDDLSDIGSKDALMELQGVWGLEVAEMHRFNSATGTDAVKKFLRKQSDRFRPPYGRTVIDMPRRVCILGTINPDGNSYLKDTTGGRSFWPMTVGRIDIDAIIKDRDQIWAEAVQLYLAKTPWWVQDEETASVEAEQEKRTDVDIWVDILAPHLITRGVISQVEILEKLGILTRDADWRHAGRIGRIMRKLGWSAARERKNGEDRVIFTMPDFVNDESMDKGNNTAW